MAEPSPPITPQAPQSNAEAHYENLLAYFKHLLWLTGGALGVVVLVGGYLFHSNLQDSLRDAGENAKREATRVATEESREAVKKAFDEEHVKQLVEDVAKEKINTVTDTMIGEKVGPIADKMIERQLASKLQPIEQSIVLIGRISECEARIHLGYRSSLFELMDIVHGAHDPYVREFAKTTLASTTKGYEDFWTDSVKQTGTNSALGLLSARWAKPGQPQPTGPLLANVVNVINKNDDLNTVTLAFLSFRELTREQVKMFDFAAVKSWCAKNQQKCQ